MIRIRTAAMAGRYRGDTYNILWYNKQSLLVLWRGVHLSCFTKSPRHRALSLIIRRGIPVRSAMSTS